MWTRCPQPQHLSILPPILPLLCLTQVTTYGSPSTTSSLTQLAVCLCSCVQSSKNKQSSGTSSTHKKMHFDFPQCFFTERQAGISTEDNRRNVWKPTCARKKIKDCHGSKNIS